MSAETDPSGVACDSPPEGKHKHIRVLLIDDDRDDQFLTAERLAEVPGRPYLLESTALYTEGLEAICNGTHDVFLLDFRLGAKTGIDLLREAQSRGSSSPVILLTGQGQSRTAMEALEAGADDYLEKDRLTADLLDRAIRYAIVHSRAERELEQKVQERTEELARANAALRDADRRKDEFLATLAHELRNPLAPIRNALELIRLTGEIGDTIDRQRQRIERQVAQLQRLIEDLLDVSRIAAGKLQLRPEVLTVQDLIDVALETSGALLAKSNLTLTVEVPTEPIRIKGDRVRLAQAVTNLLHNASKFTESGGKVWVVAQQLGSRVEIVVRDNGLGIQKELLPEIFTLFTQVDRSMNRSPSGLGVGLALVRKFLAMHDGTVTAQSEGLGTGATFTISLPVAA